MINPNSLCFSSLLDHRECLRERISPIFGIEKGSGQEDEDCGKLNGEMKNANTSNGFLETKLPGT